MIDDLVQINDWSLENGVVDDCFLCTQPRVKKIAFMEEFYWMLDNGNLESRLGWLFEQELFQEDESYSYNGNHNNDQDTDNG